MYSTISMETDPQGNNQTSIQMNENRADPTLRGFISGQRLDSSIDDLAVLYLATIQSIAYGTKHIIEEMNKQGYHIKTIFITGGSAKNKVIHLLVEF